MSSVLISAIPAGSIPATTTLVSRWVVMVVELQHLHLDSCKLCRHAQHKRSVAAHQSVQCWWLWVAV